MKNRVKRAGFPSIKAFAIHIGKNPRFLYTNKDDIGANLLLDALIEKKGIEEFARNKINDIGDYIGIIGEKNKEIQDLKAKIEALEMLYKASNGNEFIKFLEKHFMVMLNSNDVFCFAGADGEDIEEGELKVLYELNKKYGYTGMDAWTGVAREYKEDVLPIYLKTKEDIAKYKEAYQECSKNKEKYFSKWREFDKASNKE